MTSYVVTQEGMEKLRKELEERVNVVRKEIAQSIKEAKEQGDLSENAEYAEAKHAQAENEARIAELEALIKNAEVVKHDGRVRGVQIGSTVDVRCNGKEMRFTIVGANEADPGSGKITSESPFGKALMGRNEGEDVTVETPAGTTECTIVRVK